MERSIEEIESDASRGLWLGGEAVVRRYPRKYTLDFGLTRSIAGILVLAFGLGCASGGWFGYRLCRKRDRRFRRRLAGRRP
jgi:hypothetical protein